MIIECPSCRAQYNLPGELPPSGRKVRCAKCANVWVATPEPAEDKEDAAEAPSNSSSVGANGGHAGANGESKATPPADGGAGAAKPGAPTDAPQKLAPERGITAAASDAANAASAAIRREQDTGTEPATDAGQPAPAHAFWPDARADDAPITPPKPLQDSLAARVGAANLGPDPTLAAVAAAKALQGNEKFAPRFRQIPADPPSPAAAKLIEWPSSPPANLNPSAPHASTKSTEELARHLRWGQSPPGLSSANGHARDPQFGPNAQSFDVRGEAGPAPLFGPAAQGSISRPFSATQPASNPQPASIPQPASFPQPASIPQPEWARPPQHSPQPQLTAAPSPRPATQGELEQISREPEPRRTAIGSIAGWVMLVALVAGMGIFAVRNREQVVQSLPGAARLYAAAGTPVNVHGLEFRNVSTEWIMEDGRATVEVRGEINNITSKVQKIPSLVVGLRDEEGTELCNWRGSTVLDRLAPGNVTRFSVRIPAPQEAVGTALVRFAKKP